MRFSPDARLTALAGAGALLALGLAFAADAAGRLLFVLAALVLAAYAVTDLVFRPRLAVDLQGIAVHSPFTRVALAWDAVESVRADQRLRFGLRSVTLEIDAGPHLVVLSRRALGADPEEAAALVLSFDPRPR